jgi:hypothetical protein
MGICFRFFHSRPPPPPSSSPRTPGKLLLHVTMRSTIKVSVMQRGGDMFGWSRPLCSARALSCLGTGESSLTPRSVLMILGSLTGENLINLCECRQSEWQMQTAKASLNHSPFARQIRSRLADWKSILLALTFRCVLRCKRTSA